MAMPSNLVDFDLWAAIFGESIAVTRDGESLTNPSVAVVYINADTGNAMGLAGPDGRLRFRGADVYVDAETPLRKDDRVRIRGLDYTCNLVIPQTDANWVRCVLTCHADRS